MNIVRGKVVDAFQTNHIHVVALRDRAASLFLPNHFFDKLAGTDQLRKQVVAGVSARDICNSWKKDLEKYGQLRRKYLLYAE